MPKHDPSDIAEFELDSPLTPEQIHGRVKELIRYAKFEGESSRRGFSIRKAIYSKHGNWLGPWVEGELEFREEGTLIHLMVKIADYNEHKRWKHSLISLPFLVIAVVSTWIAFASHMWIALVLTIPLIFLVAFNRTELSPEEALEEISPVLTGEVPAKPSARRSQT